MKTDLIQIGYMFWFSSVSLQIWFKTCSANTVLIIQQ